MPIYFFDGRDDWEILFSEFVERVKVLGYRRFSSVFRINLKPSVLICFRQICVRAFGVKFERIYQSFDRSMDFDVIPF